MDSIRCKISFVSHLALHIVVLGDGEEKPAEDRPHWQEGNGSLRVKKLFLCCALLFHCAKNPFSIQLNRKTIALYHLTFTFFRNDFHPIALKNILVDGQNHISPHPAWSGRQQPRAGRRGRHLSPICRPAPSQVDFGSGHPLVLGDSHPFVILDSTLLPSSHSFCSLSPLLVNCKWFFSSSGHLSHLKQ